MDVKILVPELGESIIAGNVSEILKKEGDRINEGDIIFLLETDKVSVEVPSTTSGMIKKICVKIAEDVGIGKELAIIDTNNVNTEHSKNLTSDITSDDNIQAQNNKNNKEKNNIIASPSAQKKVSELNLDISKIPRTGKNGILTKEDVLNSLENNTVDTPLTTPNSTNTNLDKIDNKLDSAQETRTKISKLRQSAIKNLKTAQNNCAILTTFNKVRMDNVINLRKKYKDIFHEVHDTKLGFMSFFVKAAIYSLQKHKSVNAQIEGDDIVYKNYYNIGIAVNTEKGLVVPVLKNANQMNIAQIEKQINAYAKKARNMELQINDMMSGTFTISNGGTYGSLLSTPILNYPQSAILGLHSIQKEVIVDENNNDNIIVGNTMYIALSYDHRIIDGKEAVSFLQVIKECIEEPIRIILDI